MKKITVFFFFLFTLSVFSQDIERITISGTIIVSSEDKEGVTVFNSSSNKGTVTDEKGDFEIKVALNDVVEFGALQFKDFTVTITEEVITSKRMTVLLVEEVNKLDEVVLLPFGLTGNLNADLENVRTYNVSLDAIYFGLNNMNDFEFSADDNTKVDNAAFDEYQPRMGNMVDFVNIAKLILDKKDKSDKKKEEIKEDKALERTPLKKKLDSYGTEYINTNFKIPLKKVEGFIEYVEEQGVDSSLLEKNKEVQFLERITQLSKSFLIRSSEKE